MELLGEKLFEQYGEVTFCDLQIKFVSGGVEKKYDDDYSGSECESEVGEDYDYIFAHTCVLAAKSTRFATILEKQEHRDR